MVAIYINDAELPFTRYILDGYKTVETRTKRVLDRYCGQRVGILSSGCGAPMLVGECVFHADGEYESVKEFDACHHEHCIPWWSKYHMLKCVHKYKYRITDVVKYDVPLNVEIKIRHGRTACEI